jgi:hypothetical protein
MIRCKLTSAGSSALAEVLGRNNQGPTQLFHCYMDNGVLANGLRGNSSLKSFRLPCIVLVVAYTLFVLGTRIYLNIIYTVY